MSKKRLTILRLQDRTCDTCLYRYVTHGSSLVDFKGLQFIQPSVSETGCSLNLPEISEDRICERYVNVKLG